MIFKQAFRVAFVALIWKQYKATIISTLLLIIFLFIVSNIHQDYLAAVQPEDIDRATFVYKWLAYAGGVLAYFLFHIVRGRLKPKEETTKDKIAESKELTNTDEDPFSAIRERKTLRSRADFLIGDEDK